MIAKIKSLFYDEIPFFLASFVFVWQALFYLLPLCCLLFFAFKSIDSVYVLYAQCAFVINYVHTIIILKTLLLASLVAAVCLCVAYPVVYWITFKTRYTHFFLLLATVPFFTNILILMYSWITLLEKKSFLFQSLQRISGYEFSLLYSWAAVFIVLVYCYIPFMVLPLYASLQRIDIQILYASADLGASAWQTFYRIILPLTFQGIKNGFLLVAVPVCGEYAIPAIVGGEKTLTIGSVVVHYIFTLSDFSLAAGFVLYALLLFLVILAIGNKVCTMIMRSIVHR